MNVLRVLTEEERACPLCGNDNQCKHGEGGCWCEDVVIPKELLDKVPEDKKGKACICRACIEKYT